MAADCWFKALLVHSASASMGLAKHTASAKPACKIDSATSGMLMRLVAITGKVLACLSLPVNSLNAARGTMVAMVGIRASCQPMPVLNMEAPAASMRAISARLSSQVEPSSTKSSTDRRKIMMKSLPHAARMPATISCAKRWRFSKLPPYSSSRWLVRLAMN